jgi:hypothetical protein
MRGRDRAGDGHDVRAAWNAPADPARLRIRLRTTADLSRPRADVVEVRSVPIVSVFLGIVVRMFHDDHPPPHMHVEYAEYAAVVDIRTGRLLGGQLPPRVRRLVEEWRRARRTDLQKAWLEAESGRQPRRIRPLE